MRIMRVMTCALVLAAAGGAWAQLSSPGFESGPDVQEISFAPGEIGLGWVASNTDGERERATGPKPAAEGSFYASLLQNGGAYGGQPLGIGNFGFSGFDRIYATFAVSPNTEYEVSFQHAGDDRFGYVADTSVVEIVDADSNTTLSQQFFSTPGLFDWTTESFSFTSGPGTNNAAIAFTVMGSGGTSGVFDDVHITAVPGPGAAGMLGLGALVAARRRR